MPRERGVVLYMLEVIGDCEVVRRQTFHLLPHHRVTINNTLREMVESGLIKAREKGYKKHYVLKQKGREFLMEQSTFFENHEFLPSNIRAATWERLIQMGDVFIMLDQQEEFFVFSFDRTPLNQLTTQDTNIFYPATDIKHYLGGGQSLPSLQYSRIAGLLLTPDAPYRIYHTRNVAMEERMSGECNIFNLLCTNVYPNLRYDTWEMARVLIFGDRDMVSAEKILYNTLYPNNTAKRLRGLGKHKKKPHQVTQLIDSNTLSYQSYYLPLKKDAMPLLRLFARKGALDNFREDAYQGVLGVVQKQELSKIFYRVGNDSFFYVADWNISWIGGNLSKLDTAFKHGTVTIICMQWQLDFWTRFSKPTILASPISSIPSALNMWRSIFSGLASIISLSSVLLLPVDGIGDTLGTAKVTGRVFHDLLLGTTLVAAGFLDEDKITHYREVKSLSFFHR